MKCTVHGAVGPHLDDGADGGLVHLQHLVVGGVVRGGGLIHAGQGRVPRQQQSLLHLPQVRILAPSAALCNDTPILRQYPASLPHILHYYPASSTHSPAILRHSLTHNQPEMIHLLSNLSQYADTFLFTYIHFYTHSTEVVQILVRSPPSSRRTRGNTKDYCELINTYLRAGNEKSYQKLPLMNRHRQLVLITYN